MKPKTKIYQVYYDTESEANCVNGTYKHYNLLGYNSLYFENEAIIEIVKHENDCQYLGILSHNFFIKNKRHTIRSIEEQVDGKHKAYSFFPHMVSIKNHLPNMARSSNMKGVDYVQVMKTVLKDIGITSNLELEYVLYQNAFICDLFLYRRYVYDWLWPAIDVMESNEKIRHIVNKEIPYPGKANNYTIRPFICEMLFALFCTHQKINIKQL